MKKLITFIFLFQFQISYGQIISTIAGNGTASYSGDGGMATSAELNYPGGLTFDNNGNLFISDHLNNRIRKINTAGTITTFAGNGNTGFSGDNGLAVNSSIDAPSDVEFDAQGNLYITDFNNHRIRKIDSFGIITTFAGNGMTGVSGDGALATSAAIGYPYGIVFDSIGNLYITQGNDHCVRKINTSGVITTIAGITDSSSYNGDGIPATSAHINFPGDIAIDPVGNIYISEIFGHRIRKVDTAGIIHTIAGTGIAGYNGDNIAATAAQLRRPNGLSFDDQWNLYIAEAQNNRIRKIDSSGTITTVAGIGSFGFSGDGGLATNAQLNYPIMLTFDPSGNMFISDDFNHRIRKVTAVNVGVDTNQNESKETIFPNPFSNQLNLTFTNNEETTLSLYDILAQQVLHQTFTNTVAINTEKLDAGIYIYILRNDKGVISTGKVVKQ